MRKFDLDPEIIAFVESYVEVSNLSTTTSIARQRIDYEATVKHFYHPHPPGLSTRDDRAEGRHGMIPLRLC